MIAFLLARPTWIIIAALIAALITMHVAHLGRIAAARGQAAAAIAELANYKLAAANELAKTIAANQAEEEKRKNEDDKIRADLESRLRSIGDQFKRLRHAPAATGGGGGAVPEIPGAPGVDHGTAEADQLPRCVAVDQREGLIDLLENASITAQQLIACQEALKERK